MDLVDTTHNAKDAEVIELLDNIVHNVKDVEVIELSNDTTHIVEGLEVIGLRWIVRVEGQDVTQWANQREGFGNYCFKGNNGRLKPREGRVVTSNSLLILLHMRLWLPNARWKPPKLEVRLLRPGYGPKKKGLYYVIVWLGCKLKLPIDGYFCLKGIAPHLVHIIVSGPQNLRTTLNT